MTAGRVVTAASTTATATATTTPGASSDPSLVLVSDVWEDAHRYGATGDGITDDHAALTAALEAAGRSGGTVYLPPGSYAVGNTLQVPSGVVLQGAGRHRSTVLTTPAFVTTAQQHRILSLVNCRGSSVRDLSVVGDDGDAEQALGFEAATDCSVERCVLAGTSSVTHTGWGVFVGGGSRNVVVRDCLIDRAGGNGVEINDSSFCAVLDCRIERASNNGVELYMARAGEGLSNRVERTWVNASGSSGIAGFGVSGTVLRDNVVSGSAVVGILLTSSEILGPAYPSTDCLIADNVVMGSGNDNVSMTGTLRCTVRGNSVSGARGVGGVGGSGITVRSPETALLNNVCTGNQRHGIHVRGASTTLVANVCTDNSRVKSGSADGIRVESTSGVTLVANRCSETQTTKLQQFGISLLSATDCVVVGNSTTGNLRAGVYDSAPGATTSNRLAGNDDGALVTNRLLSHQGSTAGFFGATPVSRPVVAPSGSAVQTLQRLLAALTQLGLVTDRTTP